MTAKSKIIKKDQVDKDVSLGSRLDMKESADTAIASDKKVISKNDLGSLHKANNIIEEAKTKAKIIKDGAKEIFLQVEEKMEEAKRQGFEQGRQEGLASVTELLVKIEKQNQVLLDKIEKEAISLVYEIANKIIGDSLKTSDEALMGMVRQALQSSMGNELSLFLHPKDFARLKKSEPQLMSNLQAIQSLSLKSSENVQEGGCVVESELGTIDAQLEYQLDAIKRALEI